MKIRTIALSDKALLQTHFLAIGEALSEYCFSNIYLFRDKHQYQIIQEERCLFIKGVTYDGKKYLMPGCHLNDHCESYLTKLEAMMDGIDMVFPIPQGWLKYFPEKYFYYEVLDDDMDYLFKREKLRDYPGRKLHKKRNLVKQFRHNYDRDIISLESNEARSHAREILDHWQQSAGLTKDQADYYPCCEALSLYKELDLEGFLFLANGKPAGFTLGECVNERVYGLHFAKADKEVKGIYQYMFSKTAELIKSNYTMINLEQDLGSQPLRAAKSSYHPDLMAKKVRVFKRK